MAEVLLISENYIKKYTTVNGSVDPNILYPSVYLAQDKWLLPFLGTDLLNKIKNDVANNTISGDYQTLLEDYIQKMLLWWVMVDVTPNLCYRMDNGTLVQRQSEEMKTAFSILQTMTIAPFQNLMLNSLDYVLREGGYGGELQLYFEQLTPLVILSETAEETGQTVDQVEEDVNDSMENPATTEDQTTTDVQEIKPDQPIEKFVMPAHFEKEYETLIK